MFGWLKRRKETQRLTNLFDSGQWYWWYQGPYSKPRPNTDEVLERSLAANGFDMAFGATIDSLVKLMMTLPPATPKDPVGPFTLTLSDLDWAMLFAGRDYFELRNTSLAIQFSGGTIVPEAAQMMIDYVKRGEVEATYNEETEETYYDHLLSRTVFLAGIEWHRVDTFDFLRPLFEMDTPHSLAELENLWRTEFLLYPERAAKWKEILPTSAHDPWFDHVVREVQEKRSSEGTTFSMPRLSTFRKATIIDQDEDNPANVTLVYNASDGSDEGSGPGFHGIWGPEGTWVLNIEPVDLKNFK